MSSLELFPTKQRPQHFSNSRINSGKQRLNDILDQYKDKLKLNRLSCELPSCSEPVHCSLSQAIKI